MMSWRFNAQSIGFVVSHDEGSDMVKRETNASGEISFNGYRNFNTGFQEIPLTPVPCSTSGRSPLIEGCVHTFSRRKFLTLNFTRIIF